MLNGYQSVIVACDATVVRKKSLFECIKKFQNFKLHALDDCGSYCPLSML